jgi:hypothetical protein
MANPPNLRHNSLRGMRMNIIGSFILVRKHLPEGNGAMGNEKVKSPEIHFQNTLQ